MSLSTVLPSVALREYNGPFMTANATALTVGGNLTVTHYANVKNLNVAENITVTNTITTDHLVTDTFTVSGSLTGTGNITLDNYLKANYAFSNVTTFGNVLDQYSDAATSIYITNSVKRAVHGSIWLGSGSQCTVQHNLDVNPNTYTVMASFCDLNTTQQLVTPQITAKDANSFVVTCIPDNQSNSGMINFVVNELVNTHHV